jgi:uncharacterized membrane protein
MNLIYFLGRFHVLVLHLPIGIIVVLFVLEWVSRKEKYRYLQAAAPFLWGAMAISAAVTALLGYMHFSEGGFGGASADQHRFFGTTVAVLSVLIGVLRTSSYADSYKPLFFPASAVLLILIAITGHLGGNLTHGSKFLFEYGPQWLRSIAGLPPRHTFTSLADAEPFVDIVGPILDHRCGSCHNADKRESGLDLSSYKTAMRGGEDGKVIVPGNLELSELLRRITRPPDDDEFMPAEGKPPLTARQVDIIRWWISAGAPNDETLGSLPLPDDVRTMLAAELGLDSSAP